MIAEEMFVKMCHFNVFLQMENVANLRISKEYQFFFLNKVNGMSEYLYTCQYVLKVF